MAQSHSSFNRKAMAAAQKAYDEIMKPARKVRREAIEAAKKAHDDAVVKAEKAAKEAYDAILNGTNNKPQPAHRTKQPA